MTHNNGSAKLALSAANLQGIYSGNALCLFSRLKEVLWNRKQGRSGSVGALDAFSTNFFPPAAFITM